MANMKSADTPEQLVLKILEENVSRQNRFEVQISIPNLTELLSNRDETQIQYYIQDTSLPSQNLTLSEVNYMGLEKYAYLFKTTDSIICKFYDTKKQSIRNLFLSWHNAVVPNNSIGTLKYYPNQYQTKINIKVHDKTYTVIGASPISVGDFVLSHTAQDSLGTFDVTFKVKEVQHD